MPANTGQAILFIYDWQGKQIEKIDIAQRGEASLNLQAGILPAGMYHYTLVVDGQRNDYYLFRAKRGTLPRLKGGALPLKRSEEPCPD